MIPSGYKTSKVYSAVPTDGAGDLSFSRSNDTATRVNSAGLIEKVRTNVLTYSQDFSNANWVGFDVTRTGGQTDPNGGTTASLYTAQSNFANVSANFSTASSSPYTLSIYIKGTSSGSVSLRVDSGSTAAQNNISYTTSWQRFTYTFTAGASTSTVVLGGYATFTTGEGIYVAFAQAELGDIATDYIATTSAAVSVGPVANVPRLDYLNSSCPRLLLEPQRVNLALFSESFDNAAWTKNDLTVTANSTTSPDGYANADKLVASASASAKYTFQILSVSNSVAYTSSAYFKAAEYTYAFFRLGGVTGNPYVIYNLATQAVVATSGLTTSTITSVGNGWYRVTATATQTSTTLAPVLMVIPSTGYTLTVDNLPQFTGDGTSGGFIWGCQSELGSYATSYIPTLGAAVTRGADACSKTGISSLIGQTEGTLFADITIPTMANTGANLVSISLFNAGLTNTTVFDIYDAGDLFAVHVNGTAQASIQKTGFTAGRHKVAFGYKANDFVLYVDGVLVGTDTSGTVGAQDSFGLQYGTSQFIGQQYISQALVFKTRLTNDSLAELTSL